MSSINKLMDEIRDIATEMEKLNPVLDRPVKSYPQQDRVLSNGKVKSATGYVNEPTCTDVDDYPDDLGSNW